MKQVHQADIDAAKEFFADVHNETQMWSAVQQICPEVVSVLADQGYFSPNICAYYKEATK